MKTKSKEVKPKKITFPITDPAVALERMNDPEVIREFNKAMLRYGRKYKPLIEAIRKSKDIRPEDLAIVINAKAY